MCRLLGIINFDFNTHKGLLDEFFGLAETGKILPGDTPGHKDGWGIGFYDKGIAKTVKSGLSAIEEKTRIFETLEKLDKTTVLIAHLRKSAWKDTSSERHAHPFMFNSLIFAHNGTIKDFQKNISILDKRFVPAGDSKDTEVFFRHILQNSTGGVKPGILKSVEYVRKNNIYTALNLLLSDGKSLYALRDHAGKAGFAEYYTLFTSGNHIISSEVLGPGRGWKALNTDELVTLAYS